jgi:phosphoglycolate phosphatase-like HAD superfamily hydrolase
MSARKKGTLAGAVFAAVLLPLVAWAEDALPSWNEGPAKQAITAYVAKATTPGSGFVPPAERIAVFDNDGTLWPEQPIYTQVAFILAKAAEMAAKDPALRSKPAFAAIASGDEAAISRLTREQLLEVATAVQAGRTVEDYQALARDWLLTTRHPRFGRPYASLAYQPQLELMDLLRRAGFRVYIVSGGEVDFMRAYAEMAYGVPPEQVIGTSLKTRFETSGGRPEIVYLPQLGSYDDGPGKSENIELEIGRAPLVAVGNSDGDQQMLEYSAGSSRPSLQILIHHDDAEREYAYDRSSSVGRLDKALDEARARGWTVVSMKRDWRTLFAPESRPSK